jgi:AbrB family looped-hinge helix DNA binding protein
MKNGKFNGMTVTMDSAGRVVLPKAIRERAQLSPGTEFHIRVIDGRVELEPVYADVTIEKRGSFWVAAPKSKRRRVLTQEQVNATLDAIREPSEAEEA